MVRVAGFRETWLRFGGLDEDFMPFHRGLSRSQRNGYTLGVVLFAAIVLAVLDPLAAMIILGTGLWVIWNRGNRIAPWERKLFWLVADGSIFLAFVAKVSMFLEAAGLLLLVVLAHLAWVWRRR